MSVIVAVKSLHPTRKAVSEVLHDKEFLDFVEVGSARQLEAILDTSEAAIVADDFSTYYPVNIDNAAEQFDLAAAGSDPTVDDDAYWGFAKITCFMSPVNLTTYAEYAKLVKDIKFEGSTVKGKLIYVEVPECVDLDDIDKAGYWFAFYYDNDSAEAGPAAKYSDVKICDITNVVTDADIAEGINVVYLGATKEDVYKHGIAFKGTVKLKDDSAATAKEENFYLALEMDLTPIVINAIGSNPVAPEPPEPGEQ